MSENRNFIAEQIANGAYTLIHRQNGKSFIWNIFAEIVKEDKTVLEGWVYCRNCRKLLKFIGHQSSNLNRHKCYKAVKQPPTALKTVTENDKMNAIEACAAWLIEDCRPFSAITGSGFEKLVHFFIKIGANYGENVDVHDLLPDPATISRKLQKSADEMKVRYRSEITDIIKSGGASVTIDMWSDSYVKRNFLGVTLHYQKDFKLVDMVLGMKSMDFERSTGDNILKKLTSLFSEFGIDNIAAVKFVTDREENIVNALKHHTRLNCSSHLLANVLEKSFEETTQLAELLQCCKKIVKYFKKANLQHRLSTSLKSECPTRWNSNYTMFKSIVDNWSDINELLKETEESQRLMHINISTLKCLVQLCGDFQIVFNKLQLCSSPSLCFVIPSINKIKALCIPHQDGIASLSTLKTNINANIEQIWLTNLNIWHKTAFFLYPPAANMQPNDLNEIKNFCISCLSPISPIAAPSFSVSSITPSNSSDNISSITATTSADTPSPPPKQDIQFFFPDLLQQSDDISAPETPAQEIERYCSETVRMTADFDLMEWWRINSNVYPQLSKLALQIHSIPASSAAAGRAFSLAGNIITEKRNRLGPQTVDNLLFLHSQHKNINKHINPL